MENISCEVIQSMPCRGGFSEQVKTLKREAYEWQLAMGSEIDQELQTHINSLLTQAGIICSNCPIRLEHERQLALAEQQKKQQESDPKQTMDLTPEELKRLVQVKLRLLGIRKPKVAPYRKILSDAEYYGLITTSGGNHQYAIHSYTGEKCSVTGHHGDCSPHVTDKCYTFIALHAPLPEQKQRTLLYA
jgi:hypothetical protein